MANGHKVVSLAATGATLETSYPIALLAGSDGKSDYFTLSGTSMATPAVSGAVALLLQENSALTTGQVKARLMKTASKTFPTSSVSYVPHLWANFTEFYDLFSVGSGYLDVQAALANSDLAPASAGSALSPSAVYNPQTGTVTLVNGNSTVLPGSVVWGSSGGWGSSVGWGSSGGRGSHLSGASVVWGSDLAWNA